MRRPLSLALVPLGIVVYLIFVRVPDLFQNRSNFSDKELMVLTWAYFAAILVFLTIAMTLLARSNKRLFISVVSPLLALQFILIVGGGLGLSFIFLGETAMGEAGAIVIGVLLVVGVPITALSLSISKY